MKGRIYKIYTEIATKKQGSSGSRGRKESSKEFEVQLHHEGSEHKFNKNWEANRELLLQANL